MPVGQRHVPAGSNRRAPESAAVGAGPGTTVPVDKRHDIVRCGSGSWALEGVAVVAGAGI